MSLKDRFRRQLLAARQTSEEFLADFKSPEQWVKQVHADANHALWFVGHMGVVDTFFISILAPHRVERDPRMDALFGVGSQPTGSIDDYPPVEDVLKFMRDRRAVLLSIVDELSDEDFVKKTPEGTPSFLSDMGSVIEMAIWHEGLHSGQLSVVRRSLGCKPLN